MPSSLTKLGIWNLALDLVKETALQSADDVSASARFLERNYQHTVEMALRSYPWSCAKELFELSADAVNPPFGYSYRYKLPAGQLRLLPITRYGQRYGALVPHEIVGDYIHTDEGAPLRVKCIMDISNNPGRFDPLLNSLIVGSLGLTMANKFTGKTGFIDRCQAIVTQAKELAETIDAFEGSPEPVEQFDIIRVRGGDEYATRRLT